MSLPIKELIEIGVAQLEDAGIENATIDARELYCYMMGINKTQLMLGWQNVVEDDRCEQYFDLVSERVARKPLQYITGNQEFMGLPFAVNEHVLIPRQDTETMVEDVLELIGKGKLRGESVPVRSRRSWNVLDLGCGSGAIGLSLAKLSKEVKVTCSDISEEALRTAENNAASLGLRSVHFMQSDLFAAFHGKLGNKKFDLIVSNPPYICSETIETLQPEVRDFEPRSALDGGEDGLDFYRRIVAEAPEYLKKDGVIVLEIGCEQMDEVTRMFALSNRYSFVTGLQDLAGRDRIVVAALAPEAK